MPHDFEDRADVTEVELEDFKSEAAAILYHCRLILQQLTRLVDKFEPLGDEFTLTQEQRDRLYKND